MRIMTVVVLLSLTFGAFAATAGAYPPPVQHLIDTKGLKVVDEFSAPGGLKAFAGRAQGHNLILYLTPDGKHVIVGTMINAQGEDETSSAIDQYIAQPALSNAWEKLEQATWVAEGSRNPKRIVYEFTDPNCPFCHLYWLANRPYVAEGLQIRHVLVGVITPTSLTKAAAILEAEDPSSALANNEMNYRTSGPEDDAGAIKPATKPRHETLMHLRANRALMEALNVDGTPGIFYQDAQGKVHRIVGLPPLSSLPEIYRLPAQPITDPRLKPYE